MDPFSLVLLLAIVLWALPLIVAIIAHSKATAHGSRLAALKAKVEGLEGQLAEFRRGIGEAPVPVPPPRPEGSPAPEIAPPPIFEAPKPAVPAHRVRFEERLTSRWLLWLGAAALALSGLFLINYAVERGLLTPTARVVLALLLGVALTLGGEWVRRESLPRYVPANRVDLAAGALTSAGLFVAFAAVYAAHELYGLISPFVAFLGLGVIALVAFALAALHAPIVAILGLLAGFLTPALVPSDAPSVWGLFGYLTLIIIASLAVVRYRAWPWLAFGSILGSAVWTILWLIGDVSQKDVVPLLAFQSLVAASAIYLATEKVGTDAPEIWDGIKGITLVEWAAWSAIALSSVLIATIVDAAGNNDLNLVLLGLVGGLAIYAGRRWQRFDGIILFAALAILIVFALTPLGADIEAARQEVAGISGPPFEGLIGRAVWPHLLRTLLFAFLLAMAGYLAHAGAKRPQVWAAVSTLAAALLLALTYARLRDVSADRLWAAISTGAAILALAAARSLNGRREDYGSRLALGIYSAAVVVGVGFAFAFVFRNAWLTVALALQLPALAWLEDRLGLRELRLFALAVASVVLLRLVLNPYVLDYELAAPLGAQWILYGYGIPAAAFLTASRLFRRSAFDLTVTVLESGALAFALLLVAFEIRLAIEGRIDSGHLTFFEMSLHTLVWLATGWWRGTAYAVSGRPVDGCYAMVLITLGVLGVFAGQLLALNPAFTSEDIGKWPILNKLLIGYLAPALLLILIVRDLGRIELVAKLRLPAAIGALVLAFTWVTLETKHAFQGRRLLAWHQSDGEYYAYSLVWLLFAFALLAAGLWRQQPALRYGALGVLLVTVLKVFISDMAGLEGLYRVASFLGLGLSLVAIGWIYQRFVYPVAPVTAGGPASPLQ
jgi:uncharacterized membrane protein